MAAPIDRTDDHTAVLFFSHRPECEWQNKRFVRRDRKKHRQAAQSFFRNARQVVLESGLPVVEVTDAQQRGRGFGSRLANAVADTFAEGYQQVIVVGNDCPTLHEVEWKAVAERLADGTPVLGPTTDGEGAYLIGLQRDHFSRDAFKSLPWQSRTLLAALEKHLAQQAGTRVDRLKARCDVNGHRDLVALLHDSTEIPALLAYGLRHVFGSDGRGSHLEEAVESRRVSARRSRAPPRTRVGPNERVQNEHVVPCSGDRVAATRSSPSFL